MPHLIIESGKLGQLLMFAKIDNRRRRRFKGREMHDLKTRANQTIGAPTTSAIATSNTAVQNSRYQNVEMKRQTCQALIRENS